MTERPILFSSPMVLALLAGTKTQTRRIAKFVGLPGSGFNPEFSGYDLGNYCTGVPSSGYVLRSRGAGGCWNDRTEPLHSKFGVVGDRLWVRECFVLREKYDRFYYRADHPKFDPYAHNGWKPSIHMPRRASRITLELTGVRVERLQSITPEDAAAEGVFPPQVHGGTVTDQVPNPVRAYRLLWESINGAGSWAANPWVWVLGFKRVTA